MIFKPIWEVTLTLHSSGEIVKVPLVHSIHVEGSADTKNDTALIKLPNMKGLNPNIFTPKKDLIDISLGYEHTGIIRIFRGTVIKALAKIPFEIHASDKMYGIKNKIVTKTYRNVRASTIVKDLVKDSGVKTDKIETEDDVLIKQFPLFNVNAKAALEKLSSLVGKTYHVIGDSLFFGKEKKLHDKQDTNKTYTTTAFDTLATVAKSQYGSIGYWRKVKTANPQTPGNPAEPIGAGKVLAIPNKNSANRMPVFAFGENICDVGNIKRIGKSPFNVVKLMSKDSEGNEVVGMARIPLAKDEDEKVKHVEISGLNQAQADAEAEHLLLQVAKMKFEGDFTVSPGYVRNGNEPFWHGSQFQLQGLFLKTFEGTYYARKVAQDFSVDKGLKTRIWVGDKKKMQEKKRHAEIWKGDYY